MLVLRPILLLALVHLPVVLAGQTDDIFRAELNSDQVYAGSPFRLSFVLEDRRGGNFQAPDLSPFKIVGGPSSRTSTQIINGQMNSSISYSYTLLAPDAGTYEIGPASIKLAGKTYRTRPLRIEVVEPPEAEETGDGLPGQAEGDLFIKARLSKDSAYVGEQIYVYYEIFTRTDVQGADFVNFPEFRDFYTRGVGHYDRNRRQVTINGKAYTTQIIRKMAIFPQRSGKFTIEPASLRVEVLDRSNGRDAFFGFPRYRSRYLHTNRLEVTVQPLPENPPPTFNGAVGRHLFKLRLPQREAATGEGLELNVEMRGLGDNRRLSEPVLDIDTAFEIYDARREDSDFDFQNGKVVFKNKWTFVIVPKRPGKYSLSPPFTYFDIDSAAYVTLRPDTVQVQVVPGRYGLSSREGRPGAAQDGLLLEPLPAEELHRPPPDFFGSPLFWSLFSFPFAALGVALYFRRRRIRRLGLGDLRSPVERAVNEIEEALASERSLKEKQQRIRDAFERAVAAELELEIADLNRKNVRDKASARGWPDARIRRFLELLDRLDRVLYAGSAAEAGLQEQSGDILDFLSGLSRQSSGR